MESEYSFEGLTTTTIFFNPKYEEPTTNETSDS